MQDKKLSATTSAASAAAAAQPQQHQPIFTEVIHGWQLGVAGSYLQTLFVELKDSFACATQDGKGIDRWDFQRYQKTLDSSDLEQFRYNFGSSLRGFASISFEQIKDLRQPQVVVEIKSGECDTKSERAFAYFQQYFSSPATQHFLAERVFANQELLGSGIIFQYTLPSLFMLNSTPHNEYSQWGMDKIRIIAQQDDTAIIEVVSSIANQSRDQLSGLMKKTSVAADQLMILKVSSGFSFRPKLDLVVLKFQTYDQDFLKKGLMPKFLDAAVRAKFAELAKDPRRAALLQLHRNLPRNYGKCFLHQYFQSLKISIFPELLSKIETIEPLTQMEKSNLRGIVQQIVDSPPILDDYYDIKNFLRARSALATYVGNDSLLAPLDTVLIQQQLPKAFQGKYYDIKELFTALFIMRGNLATDKEIAPNSLRQFDNYVVGLLQYHYQITDIKFLSQIKDSYAADSRIRSGGLVPMTLFIEAIKNPPPAAVLASGSAIPLILSAEQLIDEQKKIARLAQQHARVDQATATSTSTTVTSTISTSTSSATTTVKGVVV